MILLQAAIAAGMYLFFLFGIIFLIGIPSLTSIIMKRWNKSIYKESQNFDPSLEKNKKEKYPRDWGILISSAIISFIILIVVCVIIVIIFDHFVPSLE